MKNPETGEEITVEEAYRLKHSINQKILYGGMNAVEFKSFKKLTADDWQKIWTRYFKYSSQMFRIEVVFVFLALSIGAFFYFSGWVKAIAGAIGVWSLMALFKKLGHREGYAEGYRDGYGEGIDKAFGIDDEEAGDIEDRALEMELDERLIKKWDEMKTPNM